MLTTEEKRDVIAKHQAKEGDTGSTEVQIALLTTDISKLTEHLKSNKHDYASRRGLTDKVNKRRNLLRYLKQHDLDRYRSLLKELSIRGKE